MFIDFKTGKKAKVIVDQPEFNCRRIEYKEYKCTLHLFNFKIKYLVQGHSKEYCFGRGGGFYPQKDTDLKALLKLKGFDKNPAITNTLSTFQAPSSTCHGHDQSPCLKFPGGGFSFELLPFELLFV